MWTNMFVLAVPVLEKIIRPILIYAVLIIGLRLAGKRELAQLNPFDLVVLLTLSNTVQNAIIGNDTSVSGGIIGAATLLTVNYLTVRFVYKNSKFEKLIEGEEDVLINHGKINKKKLEKEMISLSELEIAAHKQGYASLAHVDRAVLEPEGGISFLGVQPNPEEKRHQELLVRLDHLTSQIRALQSEIASQQPKQKV